MKYCSKCGQSLDDDAVVCVRCGCKVAGNNSVQDHSSLGYGLLGFCIPIAGLILWLVWRSETPLRAKSAGLGALISVILGVIIYIIYGVAIAAAISGLYY